MLVKTTGTVPGLVTWTDNVELCPSTTDPKLRLVGRTPNCGGDESAKSETNSSDVPESVAISSVALWIAVAWLCNCGVNVTVMVQIVTTGPQSLVAIKSGVVFNPIR